MELSSLQARILMPFIDNAVECLESMATMMAIPEEGYANTAEEFSVNDYAVVVDTSGLVEGCILIHYHIDTALEIGRQVYSKLMGDQLESTSLDDNVIEALEEFSNTLVGLATRELKKADTMVIFDPPYYVANVEKMKSFAAGAKEILTVPIQIEDVGRLYFNFIIYKEYNVYMAAEC